MGKIFVKRRVGFVVGSTVSCHFINNTDEVVIYADRLTYTRSLEREYSDRYITACLSQ